MDSVLLENKKIDINVPSIHRLQHPHQNIGEEWLGSVVDISKVEVEAFTMVECRGCLSKAAAPTKDTIIEHCPKCYDLVCDMCGRPAITDQRVGDGCTSKAAWDSYQMESVQCAGTISVRSGSRKTLLEKKRKWGHYGMLPNAP